MILLRLVHLHFPICNQKPPSCPLGSMLQEKIVVGKSLSLQNPTSNMDGVLEISKE